jgi:hypothetical protein
MAGVSGAFILLPFRARITCPAVSSTNFACNIVVIPSCVYRYFRKGRVAWPLAGIIIPGTLPGVFIGYYLRILYLPDPWTCTLFAGLVLPYSGVRLLYGRTAGAQAGTTRMGELDRKFAERTKLIRL